MGRRIRRKTIRRPAGQTDKEDEVKYCVYFVGQKAGQDEAKFFPEVFEADAVSSAWEKGVKTLGETRELNGTSYQLRSICGVTPIRTQGST